MLYGLARISHDLPSRLAKTNFSSVVLLMSRGWPSFNWGNRVTGPHVLDIQQADLGLFHCGRAYFQEREIWKHAGIFET